MSTLSAPTAPLPWRDPIFPSLIAGLIGALTLLYAVGWLPIVLSVPGWWAFFISLEVLYPTYLLYVIKPYTEPSIKRTIAIITPVVILALIARPLRVAEKWGMQITHFAIGAVVFSMKKAPEFAINRIEPSVVTRWHRFVIHYMMPTDVAFEDEPERQYQSLLRKELLLKSQKPTSASRSPSPSDSSTSSRQRHGASVQHWRKFHLPSDDNYALTAEEFKSRFIGVRRRGFKSLLIFFSWFAISIIPASIVLWLHYHNFPLLHTRILTRKIVHDTLGGLIIAFTCSGMFSFVDAVFSLLYGDGLYVGPMFTSIFASTSLSDWWVRWNRGMRDVFYHAIYKQLGGRKHPVLASAAVGLFSGLLHEYEVFLNVGPYTRFNMMKFFVAQALGVAFERVWSKYSPLRIGVWSARVLLGIWLMFTAGYFIADCGLDAKDFGEFCLAFWSVLFRVPWSQVMSWFQPNALTVA